jgi:FkbM family methyltransferase
VIVVRALAQRAIRRGDNPELELLPYFSHGGSFIDVGANIGDYSRVACLHYEHVISFEPIPELCEKLRRELGPRAHIENTALSDTSDGAAILRIPIAALGETTGLASLESAAISGQDCREIRVPLTRLDNYRLDRVDLIKIDVEGHEEAVLAGAMETIARCRPALIIEIEDRHHPGRTGVVFHRLEALGLSAHTYADGRLTPVDTKQSDDQLNTDTLGHYRANFVFVWPEQRAALPGLWATWAGRA